MRMHRSMCGTAALAAAAIAGMASASTVTFDLRTGGYEYSSAFTVSAGGYTLSFSNPAGLEHQQSMPDPADPSNTVTRPLAPNNQLAFERDSDGLVIGNFWWWNGTPLPGYTNSFTMTLTGPTNLVLTGYEITYWDFVSGTPADWTFGLTQGGVAVTAGNNLTNYGQNLVAGGPVFWQSGTSMQFQASAAVNADQLLQIGSLTFEVTSIPGSGLAAIGATGLASIARRRRR